MKPVFIFLVTLLIGLRGVAQTSKTINTYRNPVIAGDFADPSVIRVGNTYYAVGTSSEWGPAYPIYTSTDLVNWTSVGPVFNTPPDWTMGSFWAPELFFRNGMFYVYYTARRKSDKRSYIGVATTRDIRQGFTDHGLLLEWTSEAIDAFVIEADRKLYITWKAYGLDKGKDIEILGAELASDGLKVIGKAFSMLTAERNTWENGGAEGQAILKRGRYFYMTYSGNTCCGAGCNYQVGLARAEKLEGPWVKYAGNPVLTSDQTWKCPGHGTIVTTPDNRYFYLHHAYNGVDFTQTGRQGVLSELVWDDQTQWPLFRYGTATPAQAATPTKTSQLEIPDLTANDGEKALALPWVWDVSLPKPKFSVRNNQLEIANSSTGSVGNFLGLVLKKGTYTFSVEVIPQPDILQSISLYGDASNALGLGIRQGVLELWQVKDGSRIVLETRPITNDASPVRLELKSRFGQYYTFSWKPKDGQPQQVNQTPLDGSYLPRWDRAPRVGISVSGAPERSSRIQAVQMKYD